MEVRGVKAQWHSTSPFHSQPLIHHDKCAQMIWPSSTNGERREHTSFAQDPLQLIHPALLWANWSRALPACVLLMYPTQFSSSCSQRSYFCVRFLCRLCRRGNGGCKILPPWCYAQDLLTNVCQCHLVPFYTLFLFLGLSSEVCFLRIRSQQLHLTYLTHFVYLPKANLSQNEDYINI